MEKFKVGDKIISNPKLFYQDLGLVFAGIVVGVGAHGREIDISVLASRNPFNNTLKNIPSERFLKVETTKIY